MLLASMPDYSTEHVIKGLTDIVGRDYVSVSTPDRVAYSADFWPKAQIWKMGGDVARFKPDVIVWPADEADVSAILTFCHEWRIPVIPYGAGSGVCGGTVPIHGGVIVDVKRLNRMRAVDFCSSTVMADAGINGQLLEDRLNGHGLTLGHFPSSIMCSTLGGWLACRSAGQFSSRYGKIEDMVLDLRVVTADGSIVDTAERSPGAPDWTQLLVGSEGTLGIITSAQLKVHPLPEEQRFRGWRFKQLPDALAAMRRIMQSGLTPNVLRLYDPFDSALALGKKGAKDASESPIDRVVGALKLGHVAQAGRSLLDPLLKRTKERAIAGALSTPKLVNKIIHAMPTSCLLIIGFEGASASVEEDLWRAGQILVDSGGQDAGAAPGENWLKNRYNVSFKQSPLYAAGAFVDTMEVATTWDRIYSLFEGVREAVSPYALVMAHFSHAYRDGCSIYFTFAAYRRDAKKSEQLYDKIWNQALDAAHAAGATISHHHGVGLSKKHAMAHEHGEMLRVWRAIKDVLDPHGIMNPGKLFPDGAGAR
jgi:alkyldihydroxyacetonephosphate synthase